MFTPPDTIKVYTSILEVSAGSSLAPKAMGMRISSLASDGCDTLYFTMEGFCERWIIQNTRDLLVLESFYTRRQFCRTVVNVLTCSSTKTRCWYEEYLLYQLLWLVITLQKLKNFLWWHFFLVNIFKAFKYLYHMCVARKAD